MLNKRNFAKYTHTIYGLDIVSWIGLAVIVLVAQLFTTFFSVMMHFWMITKFIASLHSVNYWAFGIMGYGYDYSKKKFQIISELLVRSSIHFIFTGLFIAITFVASAIETNLRPELPMNANLGTNVVNELWKNQATLLILNLLCPVYPFGLSRVVAT